MKVVFEPSPRQGKKMRAIFSDGKVVDFGAKGMEDYTSHHDETRKQRFLSRFARLIDKYKKDPQAPMTLSTYILWNKPTIPASIRDYKQKYKLN